jgi:hypothetical protein
MQPAMLGGNKSLARIWLMGVQEAHRRLAKSWVTFDLVLDSLQLAGAGDLHRSETPFR